ncbi:hypothetical protein KI387_022913, partial [Taxus chinensis]
VDEILREGMAVSMQPYFKYLRLSYVALYLMALVSSILMPDKASASLPLGLI